MLNQLPLWCRQCGDTYESFDDNGVCLTCETPNVLSLHNATVEIAVPAYTAEEARARVAIVLNPALENGTISSLEIQ